MVAVYAWRSLALAVPGGDSGRFRPGSRALGGPEPSEGSCHHAAVAESAYEGLDFPVWRSWDSEPVPDLSRLEAARWREVLARISPGARRAALATVPSEYATRALQLVGWLEVHGPRRRWRPPSPPPAPGAGPVMTPEQADAAVVSSVPVRHGRRQVNVRLREHDYRTLARAADLTDTIPGVLARALVVRGATRVLIEEDSQRRALRAPER